MSADEAAPPALAKASRPSGRRPWPSWPQVADLEASLAAMRQVLTSPCWTARSFRPGSRLIDLEAAWARRHDSAHALLVSSGSVAVEIALRAAGVGPGDDVLVPALGWYAPAAAVSRVGARPVFFDIDPATSCPDPAAAADALTAATTAVVAVHLHSGLCDLAAFRRLADDAGVMLIEDAAQAHGGAFEGRSVGAWGDLGCFSFNQEKTLAIGEGGAVVTSRRDLYHRLFGLRTDGYAPHATERLPNGAVQGANACLSELQAALLEVQLADFDDQEARRRRTADATIATLRDIDGVTSLGTAPGTTARPFYELGLVFERAAWGDRSVDELANALHAATGVTIHRTDEPVPRCPLFDPDAPPDGLRDGAVPRHAADLYDRLLVFHHRHLLEPELPHILGAALRRLQATCRQASNGDG